MDTNAYKDSELIKVKKHAMATRSLTVAGVILIIVAGIHLAVAPELRSLFLRDIPNNAGQFWIAPFMLNHVVVGILLFPIGLSTLFAASAARRQSTLARNIALVNALSILALPIVLVLIMGTAYFQAAPFLIATILITVAALIMLFCALSLERDKGG